MADASSIARTVPYYKLIRHIAFPRLRSIVSLVFIFPATALGVSYWITSGRFLTGLNGGVVGILVFSLPSMFSDFLIYNWLLRGDPLFFLRRCFALSLVGIAIWSAVLLLGSVLSLFAETFIFPSDAFFVGTFVVVPLRTLASLSLSRTNLGRRLLFALSQPAAVLLAVGPVMQLSISQALTVFALSATVALLFCAILLIWIERIGMRTSGYSALRLFRAFLVDWLEGRSGGVEAYLDRMGVEANIELKVLSFETKKGPKAVVLGGGFHPGPFMNVGSSCLPYLLQRTVEEATGAVALVPHSVSHHRSNLVSQQENLKVIAASISMIEQSKGGGLEGGATPFVRATFGRAKASCQAFDGCALVTLTTSPVDMEDIPAELLSEREMPSSAGKLLMIDSHNCLSKPAVMDSEIVEELSLAAENSIRMCRAYSSGAFRLGAAVATAGVSLDQGLGPGGVACLVVETGDRKFAYVLIDGNNMMPGIRERLLEEIGDFAIEDGEIMTTDTHMVNAVASARLGYYRVGEIIDYQILAKATRTALSKALSNMEPAQAVFREQFLTVRVIGTETLERLSGLMHRISKLTAVTLFPVIALVALLTLLYLV